MEGEKEKLVVVGRMEGMLFGYGVWSMEGPSGEAAVVAVGCREGAEGDGFDARDDEIGEALGKGWTVGGFLGRCSNAPGSADEARESSSGISRKRAAGPF